MRGSRHSGVYSPSEILLIAACVCERERERVTSQWSVQPVRNPLNRGVCGCLCVRERERGSRHCGVYSLSEILLTAACVCVRERERVTSQWSVQPVRNPLNRGLCVCVCVCVREREGHITVECTARQKSS